MKIIKFSYSQPRPGNWLNLLYESHQNPELEVEGAKNRSFCYFPRQNHQKFSILLTPSSFDSFMTKIDYSANHLSGIMIWNLSWENMRWKNLMKRETGDDGSISDCFSFNLKLLFVSPIQFSLSIHRNKWKSFSLITENSLEEN